MNAAIFVMNAKKHCRGKRTTIRTNDISHPIHGFLVKYEVGMMKFETKKSSF